MSRPVRERIIELELDVRQVRLAPAAEVRARGRSRARRRLAGTAAAVTTLVAAAGFGLAGAVSKPSGPDTAATQPAAAAGCAQVDLRLPDDPSDVEVRVFAGAGTDARASLVARELGNRRFLATAAPGTDPAAGTAGTEAVLRYGPAAVGAATLVRSLVLGETVMRFDGARTGRAVDLVLGAGFQQVATPSEMNQALVVRGEPTMPAECR